MDAERQKGEPYQRLLFPESDEMRALGAEAHEGEARDVRPVAGDDGCGVAIRDHAGDPLAAIFPSEPMLDEVARHDSDGGRIVLGSEGDRNVAPGHAIDSATRNGPDEAS